MKHFMAFTPSNRKPNLPKIPDHFSSIGRHTTSTIGRDFKIDKLSSVLNELKKGGTPSKEKAAFYIASKVHEKISTYLEQQTSGRFSVGTLKNGFDKLINHNEDNISFHHSANSNVVSTFGEISTRIYKEKFRFGKPTKRRLIEKANNHQIVKRSKSLVDTETDYLSSKKRRSLTSYGGVNETLYTFLMSDTHITLGDYEMLYKIHKKKFKDKLSNSYFYGDSLSDTFRIKIKSETDAYSMRCKVHIVKLKNDITLKELIENTFSSTLNGEILNDSKIPIDRQLSIPTDTSDTYKCEVITALNTPLILSDYFNDNAQIIKTFSQHLGPRCIFDISIKQEHGAGIFLNHIFNINRDEKLNLQPSSYFIVLETNGDYRGSITRLRDGANFDCVAPFRFTTRFSNRFNYLAEDLGDAEKPIFSKFVKNDTDFNDSELSSFFQKDREKKIHVPYDEIHVDRNTKNKVKPYMLRFDEPRMVQLTDPKLIEIREEMKNSGLKGIIEDVSESLMNPNIKFAANATKNSDRPETDENEENENGHDGPFDPESPEFRRLRGQIEEDPDD
jgi:hypothetical protein